MSEAISISNLESHDVKAQLSNQLEEYKQVLVEADQKIQTLQVHKDEHTKLLEEN